MDGVDKQGEEEETMTVIYVDTLFLLNALVDYLLDPGKGQKSVREVGYVPLAH